MSAYRETMGQVLQRMYDNKQLQIQERELSDTELKRREEIAKELPDEEFKDRYGSRWKEVKLATATKQAKSESVEEEKLEKMDEAAGFSAGMISKLKKSYSTLTKVDPTSPTAKKLFGVLDKMNKEQLIQIVKADINFLSLLAANRLINDHNMKGAEINKLKKEEVDLDERARQLKDPKKEMMVSKGGDVKVIDKKDWPKYEKKGYVQAEETEIKEGTWAFPSNSRDIKKAKDFMRKPQPLGKEGDDASSALYSIFGDDELHDELYKAGKENPKRDARDIVKQWLKDMVGKDYRDPKDAKNVKQASFSIATPYPGTKLHEMAVNGQGGMELLSDNFTEYRRYGEAVINVNDLTAKDLKRLQNEGYVSIYSKYWRWWPVVKRYGVMGLVFTLYRLLKMILLRIVYKIEKNWRLPSLKY